MSTWRVLTGPLWRMPLLLALLSLTGLLAGLLADGPWDLVSWLALAVPVAVGIGCSLRRRWPR